MGILFPTRLSDVASATTRLIRKNFQFFQHVKKTSSGAIAYLELSDARQKYGIVMVRIGMWSAAFRTGGRP